MDTDLKPCPSTSRSSEMHCPSVLDSNMHLTPKGALPCENDAFEKRKEWMLDTPTLQPTELGFAVTLEGEREDGAEIPWIKESIQTAQDHNTGLPTTEETSHAEDTPRVIRVGVTTPLQAEAAPNHSSKLSLSSDDCVLSTPPVTPSAREYSVHEVGDAASIRELAGSPVGSPGGNKQDPVADLTEQIDSEVSAKTVETENASPEQRVFCPTAEELNFFRYFAGHQCGR
jgi:hypothetical protein